MMPLRRSCRNDWYGGLPSDRERISSAWWTGMPACIIAAICRRNSTRSLAAGIALSRVSCTRQAEPPALFSSCWLSEAIQSPRLRMSPAASRLSFASIVPAKSSPARFLAS